MLGMDSMQKCDAMHGSGHPRLVEPAVGALLSVPNQLLAFFILKVSLDTYDYL